ncbi:TetR/AcrR family transcriptional regulator [Acidiferrimicrobium sp. IK]|uniref:TetR/AcrR family transcriptional regulator n=1 Tax=Acidiferrimicrobium sp. IK TaxID=2871700 RepID=UPI0021CB90E8|nr:TetR/AcrR family transcriptional regulator [Acidiferrimicrobium sp. IK]MCU4183019.1 TetR/AcrR family transcriptional regulator [Acidiferrimicrobium sp. IK]
MSTTAGPSGPGASKGEQTRRAILDAAIARFGRDGYRATSVADIARDAAVGGTVAYAYFTSKEALFLAAVDEDAAAMIHEGLVTAVGVLGEKDWRQTLFFTMIEGIDGHPLARRLLGGLEPGVTDRVLDIPALSELRKVCAERLAAEQAAGTVRADIDPYMVGNGLVAILLSSLMAVVQFGPAAATMYADDVAAVMEAALLAPRAALAARPAAPR